MGCVYSAFFSTPGLAGRRDSITLQQTAWIAAPELADSEAGLGEEAGYRTGQLPRVPEPKPQ